MKLQELIEDKKLDWVNSDITEANFPPQETGTDFKLYHFNLKMESEEVVAEMAKDGYQPANIHELLLWQEWNDKDWVVALGSVAGVIGFRYVAYLYGCGSGRDLGLRGWGGRWDADYRFLAVKQISSDTKTPSSPELGNLVTLALKSATNKQLLEELSIRLTNPKG